MWSSIGASSCFGGVLEPNQARNCVRWSASLVVPTLTAEVAVDGSRVYEVPGMCAVLLCSLSYSYDIKAGGWTKTSSMTRWHRAMARLQRWRVRCFSTELACIGGYRLKHGNGVGTVLRRSAACTKVSMIRHAPE